MKRLLFVDFTRLWALVVSVLFFQAVVFADAAMASKRVALVIGNSNYEHIQVLRNPQNDARLMAKTLGEAGFEVRELIDGNYRDMKRALLDFGRTLREPDIEAGLIYYAGHGIQVRGENYLIPVNALLTDEDEVGIEGINVNDFLQVMNSSSSPVNIVVLDACRNNPFKGSFRSASRGLAPVDAPMGTLIAYATSPGQVASDGNSSNSPYTEALSRAIVTSPGEPIESVFKQARRNVLLETDDKQVPWEVSSITGDFYFYPERDTPADAASEAPGAPSDLDVAYWTAIRDNPTAGELKAYLDKFPAGLFADLAALRLKALENKPQVQASLDPAAAAGTGPGGGGADLPIPENPKDLTRAVQEELNRLGCDAGTPDGAWGPRSARALSSLKKEADVRIASTQPTGQLLQQLRTFEGRLCPVVCTGRYERRNNECVLKTCPSGQLLSSTGKCYAKSNASSGSQSSSASGNCFMFNGQRYCD